MLTPAVDVYKQKLFYHIQAKGDAMFGNFILFTQLLLYLILLQWTFKLINSSMSVRILCVCEYTVQCLVVLGPAGGHYLSGWALARKVSSKFGRANVNDRLKILKDTILIYLFLTSFLPMHSIHCPTPCTCHASPTVPPAGHGHACFMYALVRLN